MEKRIAIWIHGGVGTGHFSQGFSMLGKVVSGLAASNEIVIYSQARPDPSYVSPDFVIRSAPESLKKGWLRWLWLSRCFLTDHARGKFALVFAFWGYPAGFIVTLLARLKSIPSIVYLLGSDAAGVASIGYGVFQNRFKRKIALWTYRTCSSVIVLTEYQRRQLMQFGFTGEVTVIPWGPDLLEFYHRPKEPADMLRILQVAHLNPVKDQAMLLRTFAAILKHRRAELRIIGYDTMNGKIKRMAGEMNLAGDVTFLGMLPYSEMPSHYHWADIYIQTSLSEGQGMAVTEAAACGVLLCGTTVGIMHDFGDTVAVTVDNDDAVALAEKIIDVVQNPVGWKIKTDAGVAWVTEHSFQHTVKEIDKHIDTVITHARL